MMGGMRGPRSTSMSSPALVSVRRLFGGRVGAGAACHFRRPAAGRPEVPELASEVAGSISWATGAEVPGGVRWPLERHFWDSDRSGFPWHLVAAPWQLSGVIPTSPEPCSPVPGGTALLGRDVFGRGHWGSRSRNPGLFFRRINPKSRGGCLTAIIVFREFYNLSLKSESKALYGCIQGTELTLPYP
ncbi:hypothetical protein J6590_092398 [Homalodisca vitripennis]|nr:hypothetical protein J6590_092398 [Homalodisca vitripennis]